MNSYTSTQLATFTTIPSFIQSLSSTFSQIPSYSASPSYSPSPSYSQSLSYTLVPRFAQCPSLTQCPSITTPTFSLTPRFIQPSNKDATILSNITDNVFYGIITAILVIFIVNISCSIHYYNAYTNEKMRKRIVEQSQINPYHNTVRGIFNQI